jgi:hypothetical protein
VTAQYLLFIGSVKNVFVSAVQLYLQTRRVGTQNLSGCRSLPMKKKYRIKERE